MAAVLTLQVTRRVAAVRFLPLDCMRVVLRDERLEGVIHVVDYADLFVMLGFVHLAGLLVLVSCLVARSGEVLR